MLTSAYLSAAVDLAALHAGGRRFEPCRAHRADQAKHPEPASRRATANTDVVRIADPTLVDNATASTQLNNVHMGAARNTDLQRWRIDRDQTTDAVRFVNVATGGCLSVFNRFGNIDGNIVLQEYCVPNWSWQRWRVVESGVNGTVRLVNVGTGRCLTVDPNSTGQNPYLLVFTCGTQRRQDFRLVGAP